MTHDQFEMQQRRKAAQLKIEMIVERVSGKPFPGTFLADALEAIAEALETLEAKVKGAK